MARPRGRRAPPGERGREGLVSAHHGGETRVRDAAGETWRCAPPRRGERPVCGDRVLWEPAAGGGGRVLAVRPRRNLLARPDGRGGQRPLAANLDRVVVVVAPDPPLQELLLDRYLVAAEHFAIPAAVLLNKTDLAATRELDALVERLAPYADLGYPLRLASTRSGAGMDGVGALLGGGRSMLVGQSGVGKSSLIRALAPDAPVAVGALSAATGHGRHTTSATTLYPLPGGGELVDSPGVRDFGLWHLPPEALARGYVELREPAGRCRFRDCSHRHEPDCGVREALARGAVSAARYQRYRTLYEQLRGVAEGGGQALSARPGGG